MTQTLPARRGRWRATAVALVGAALAVAPATSTAMAQETPDPAYSATVETFDTGVNNGYQLALDPVNRSVYFSDAKWRVENRAGDGTITANPGTGKLVEFDTETRAHVRDHSFLDLTRNDGNGKEGEPFDWTGVTGSSLNSMRTTFSPYGVAVDGTTTDAAGNPDPTIITTTARGRIGAYGGNVVVYQASQGAPTDADRIWKFDDGTPIFDGIRRIAVNTQTHKAYVSGFGTARGGDPATRPGFVTVIDLLTKNVDARIKVPGNNGAIGVAVDEEANLVYVGGMIGENLHVIDGAAVNTSDPKNIELNNAAISTLPAEVGPNARPTYNAFLERVYVSAYDDSKITVVEADLDDPDYGEVIEVIETGPTNAVEVDGERGLLYSANLGDQEVVIFDTDTHEELLSVPTSGNALNIGIDPVTRDAWVSNFSSAGKVDVISVTSPDEVVGTTSDGAQYWVPKTWTVGEPLLVRGTGWTLTDGSAGSTIAVKIDRGAVSPTEEVTELDDVWAVAQADAQGNWSLEIPYPDRTNSNAVWGVGQTHELHFLTGSLADGDRARSGPATVTIAAPDEAPVAQAAIVDTTAPLGGTVRITGTGWLNTAGTAGSRIAVKWDEGAYSRVPGDTVHANATIWQIVEAGIDGYLDAEITVPTGATSGANGSTPAFPLGNHTLRLLTGSLLTGDVIRTQLLESVDVVPGRTANQSFVTAALTDFLGEADPAAVTAGVAAIDGGQSRSAFLRDLSTSDEWLEAVVQDLYVDTLGRPGDAAGVAFWVERIRDHGWTVARVAATFYSSPEYFNGIGGGTVNTWITDLYGKLLGRSPEAGGVAYWSGEVASQGRGKVALRFFQTPESARTRVVGLYDTLLGRAPSSGDISYWSGVVVARGDLTLAVSLAASPEYVTRAQVRFP